MPRAVPRAPNDPLDRFGNLMAYLWTEGRGALEFYLNQLADGLLEIVVRVGDELVSLVVQSEEAVAECTDWFLQHTLGVDLDEVVNWLGFVFDWEAVLLNKDALGSVLDLVLEFLREQLAYAEATAENALEFLRGQLDDFPDLSDQVRGILDQPAQQRPPGESHLERAGADPSAQWGLQTLQSYGGATGMSTDQSFDFVAAIKNALVDAGAELEHVTARLVALVESGAVTGQPVLQIVEAALLVIGDGMIDIAGKVVGDLVAVLVQLFDALVAVADERIDLPVLTALYESQIVPGGTLTIRDAVLLAASLLMTVGHKLAFETDLFSQAQLDAIHTSESLPVLVHKLEGAPVAANTPRMPVGGLVGVLSSMFKTAYVYYWFQDTWYDYAPNEVKLMDLNFPKAACDAMAWGNLDGVVVLPHVRGRREGGLRGGRQLLVARLLVLQPGQGWRRAVLHLRRREPREGDHRVTAELGGDGRRCRRARRGCAVRGRSGRHPQPGLPRGPVELDDRDAGHRLGRQCRVLPAGAGVQDHGSGPAAAGQAGSHGPRTCSTGPRVRQRGSQDRDGRRVQLPGVGHGLTAMGRRCYVVTCDVTSYHGRASPTSRRLPGCGPRLHPRRRVAAYDAHRGRATGGGLADDHLPDLVRHAAAARRPDDAGVDGPGRLGRHRRRRPDHDKGTVDRIVGSSMRTVRALRENELFVRIVELDPELLLPYLLSRRGRSQQAILDLLVGQLREGQATGEVRDGDPDGDRPGRCCWPRTASCSRRTRWSTTWRRRRRWTTSYARS